MTMDLEEYLRRDYISGLIEKGMRLDEREFDQYREIKIVNGFIKEKAEGSSYVELGDTKVIAGVKMGIGDPFSDRPEEGVLMTNAEIRPIGSPKFELGPPGEVGVELARVVDRGIRESKIIDTSNLLIGDGKVWMVFVDIHVLDHCGNLIDASGIAAMSALLDAKIPKYEDGAVLYGEHTGDLPVSDIVVPVTVAKVGKHLICDPSIDEEYALDARLTVATTDRINAMQKGGTGTLTRDEIMDIVDLSFLKGGAIRQQIKDSKI